MASYSYTGSVYHWGSIHMNSLSFNRTQARLFRLYRSFQQLWRSKALWLTNTVGVNMFLNCKIAKHGASEKSCHPLTQLGQRALSSPRVPLSIIGNESSKRCVSTPFATRCFSNWSYSGVISNLACTMEPQRNVRLFYTTSKWDVWTLVSRPSHLDIRFSLTFLYSSVLTSFDLARREIDALDTLPWSCIIVDEVHRVKNETAKITVAYHRFNCLRRFGLTGTTIQNSYKEMWTILDWTNPDRLGTSSQWRGFVVKPLTTGQSAGATEEERAKALVWCGCMWVPDFTTIPIGCSLSS